MARNAQKIAPVSFARNMLDANDLAALGVNVNVNGTDELNLKNVRPMIDNAKTLDDVRKVSKKAGLDVAAAEKAAATVKMRALIATALAAHKAKIELTTETKELLVRDYAPEISSASLGPNMTALVNAVKVAGFGMLDDVVNKVSQTWREGNFERGRKPYENALNAALTVAKNAKNVPLTTEQVKAACEKADMSAMGAKQAQKKAEREKLAALPADKFAAELAKQVNLDDDADDAEVAKVAAAFKNALAAIMKAKRKAKPTTGKAVTKRGTK